MSDESAPSEGLIEVMSDRLANQIAAGEVVQRPASVAKELVENALDAGASSVEVLLKDAGSTLVQVIDDGCGMGPGDAERCFERHATSKLRSVDDLERIRTLGFRGEALASIAAVSQVTLKTKRVEDEAGSLVRVEGGEPVEKRPCAIPSGTSVAVRNLFFNVPARRNFLKTPATELKHLSQTVQSLALANPDTAVRLEHDGHEHYDLPAARNDGWQTATRARILGLFGSDHEGELVAVEDESSDLRLRGFVGAPSFHRKTRGEQFLFVNGRAVTDRYLSHAVKKAYGELVPDGAFPFFALFLAMNPERVDVNVHPQKEEVKFDDQSGIYGFLRSAVRRALGRVHVSPQMNDGGEDKTERGADAPGSDEEDAGGPASPVLGDGTSSSRPPPTSFQPRQSSGGGSERSSAGPSARPSRSEGASPSASPGDRSDTLYHPPDAPDEASSEDALPSSPQRETRSSPTPASNDGAERSGPRPVWGLHDTYVVTPTETGIMLVDQRAAHVRVLYERARAHLRDQQGASQRLLFPHTVELSPAEIELLNELRTDLDALGFELERLSGRTVSVRGVPTDVPDGNEDTILEELLEQYQSAQNAVEDERREHLAKTMAQRSAVGRGQSLSEEERRALLHDLFDCEMPYADPTGTPTIVKFSMEELADRFGR
ncbi:DNA mismatch repair endonuclease MutL [Salinibacter altiplanensis]|uniref:DNA mismatch repair endonuclease MutL n=1 Tax=Salinibacter altiplanensis TaxID=1803181 RepID=UPI001E59A357|nr:DNA mismatch repair endonuclease MutL [Salinibacter altiplanensis]